MRNLIKAVKSINIKQILTVFIAGCLIFVSTACNQDSVARVETEGQSAKRETARTYQGNPRDTYDKYDANQDYKESFNGYDDDRRYDAETAAKAQTLIDTAKRRKADNVGEFVDNVGDRAINEKTTKRALGKFSDKLERNQDKAAEYIDNKSNKLQRNLGKVPEGAADVFDEATDTAKGAIKDAKKATKKTSKNIKDNFEDLDVDVDLS